MGERSRQADQSTSTGPGAGVGGWVGRGREEGHAHACAARVLCWETDAGHGGLRPRRLSAGGRGASHPACCCRHCRCRCRPAAASCAASRAPAGPSQRAACGSARRSGPGRAPGQRGGVRVVVMCGWRAGAIRRAHWCGRQVRRQGAQERKEQTLPTRVCVCVHARVCVRACASAHVQGTGGWKGARARAGHACTHAHTHLLWLQRRAYDPGREALGLHLLGRAPQRPPAPAAAQLPHKLAQLRALLKHLPGGRR